MDNMYTPPDDGSQDFRYTQPIGPMGAQYEQAGSDQQAPTATAGNGRSGRLRRWGFGVTAAAVLVLGGGAAVAALPAGSPAPAAGSATEAAALQTALSSASSRTAAGSAVAGPTCRRLGAQLRADGHPRAASAVLRSCRRGMGRLRALGGIHGQVTYQTTQGPRVLAFERGVIESISSSAVIVRAPDATTWTWDLVSNTLVRHDGRRASNSALSDGEQVFVGGPVSGGSNDARLIVIRPAIAAGSGSPPGSSTSGASSAS
jgi:hypothetical protein